MTSNGAATLHPPALEAPAVGPSADVRPRATGGSGGKAGNQDDDEGNDEDCGGWRQDSSIPGPETTAVVPECQRKTGEMRGGREECRIRVYNGCIHTVPLDSPSLG